MPLMVNADECLKSGSKDLRDAVIRLMSIEKEFVFKSCPSKSDKDIRDCYTVVRRCYISKWRHDVKTFELQNKPNTPYCLKATEMMRRLNSCFGEASKIFQHEDLRRKRIKIEKKRSLHKLKKRLKRNRTRSYKNKYKRRR